MLNTTNTQAISAKSGQGMKRVVMGVTLAVASLVAMSTWANGPGHRASGHGEHHTRHQNGVNPGLFMGKPKQVDRAVDRLLRGLDATEAQRTQVKQIATAAAADLRKQREASRGQRGQEFKLFTAPVVDAAAVESLRQQRLAQHDQASKRLTQAMLDVSAVLTPEQRAKLGERMKASEKRMEERMKERAKAAQERQAKRAASPSGAAASATGQ